MIVNMIPFLIVVVVLLLIVSILFSFPQLSPIPYFPSNKKDLPSIIKALDLKNKETIIDLGAGDGIVIFEAANKAYQKKLNTQFVGLDINPILVGILHLRRLFHKNKHNIHIVWGDMFKINYKHLTSDFRLPTADFRPLTYYIYISPRLIEKTLKKILTTSPQKIVSYMYPITSLKNQEHSIRGFHSIFYYELKKHLA